MGKQKQCTKPSRQEAQRIVTEHIELYTQNELHLEAMRFIRLNTSDFIQSKDTKTKPECY